MRFTDACAAAPFGSPTRASLLTGPYPATVGVTDWIDWQGLVQSARGTPGSSVRRGDWKLIEFYEDGRRELYNLRDDLSEDRDLAAGHPDVARDLHEELAAWRETVAARIPERKE